MKYLTGEKILPAGLGKLIEQAKFTYPAPAKIKWLYNHILYKNQMIL